MNIRIGLRVWTIDARWGTVTSKPDDSGWFDVTYKDGRRACLNRERVSESQTPGIRSSDGSVK